MIARDCSLPNEEFDRAWEAIYLSPEVKSTLVGQAILSLQVRRRLPFAVAPLHGLILLTGPPGTGKTTLAQGLASRVASALRDLKVTYLQVDPHALASSALGKSQQEITRLFQQVLPEAAAGGACIVLLDEVETLAISRYQLSMEANPIDVHRATDAVLAGLDLLTQDHPNTLVIATTNFRRAVDTAFLSRADVVVEVGLPDADARRQIIADTLGVLRSEWPGISRLTSSLDRFVAASDGLDGRQVRKCVVSSAASRLESAQDPGKTTPEQVETALRSAPRAEEGRA